MGKKGRYEMEKYTTIKFNKEERETLIKAAKIIREFKKAFRDAKAETITFDCGGGAIAEFGTFGTLAVTQNTLDSLVYPNELFLERVD